MVFGVVVVVVLVGAVFIYQYFTLKLTSKYAHWGELLAQENRNVHFTGALCTFKARAKYLFFKPFSLFLQADLKEIAREKEAWAAQQLAREEEQERRLATLLALKQAERGAELAATKAGAAAAATGGAKWLNHSKGFDGSERRRQPLLLLLLQWSDKNYAWSMYAREGQWNWVHSQIWHEPICS